MWQSVIQKTEFQEIIFISDSVLKQKQKTQNTVPAFMELASEGDRH